MKSIFFFFLALVLAGCIDQERDNNVCAAINNRFKKRTINMVVSELNALGRVTDIAGKSIANGRDTSMHNEVYFYVEVTSRCSIGDTITKKEGSLSVVVKKKNQNILLTYSCLIDSANVQILNKKQ
jgi:hypothetical protein